QIPQTQKVARTRLARIRRQARKRGLGALIERKQYGNGHAGALERKSQISNAECPASFGTAECIAPALGISVGMLRATRDHCRRRGRRGPGCQANSTTPS